MNAPYYRWPCGMFEGIGVSWRVYRSRSMPCTPAGDLVANFDSKEAADAAAYELNINETPIDKARAKYDIKQFPKAPEGL